jgi:hypothetical protein
LPFTAEDNRLLAAAADFGAEMLRQALAERHLHRLLLDSVEAALGASASIAESLRGGAAERLEQPAPAAILDGLRQGLSASTGSPISAEESVRLAEAIRLVAVRHGAPAVAHCIRLIESLGQLLDSVSTG